MKTNHKIISLPIAFFALLLSACDQTAQQKDSSTIDRQSLSYNYFSKTGADPGGVGGTHVNISQLLAGKCGNSACHGVGGGNGGTFKVYSPADTDAKHISNFISAQAHVIKGLNDPLAITNDYPLAHTSPLLKKPLSQLAGGIFHEGDKIGNIFATRSEQTINNGGDEYGEIYRWIAYTP